MSLLPQMNLAPPLVSVLLCACAAAAAVCAMAWLQRQVSFIQSLPRDGIGVSERPGWIRALWWLIRPLSFRIGPRLSIARRQHMLQKLRAAELDHVLSPQEWFTARCVVAAIGILVGWQLAQAFTWSPMWVVPLAATACWWWTHSWLRTQHERVRASVARELPTYLDVLTLGVEAGVSLTTAVGLCVEKSKDSPLRRAFLRFLGEVRAGRTRAEALTNLEQRFALAPITSLVTAMINAEQTGASVGQVLRAQSDQRNTERFARAEKLAMEAPVKMLGPLILCIFPCTFIVLAFPIAMQISRQFGS